VQRSASFRVLLGGAIAALLICTAASAATPTAPTLKIKVPTVPVKSVTTLCVAASALALGLHAPRLN